MYVCVCVCEGDGVAGGGGGMVDGMRPTCDIAVLQKISLKSRLRVLFLYV